MQVFVVKKTNNEQKSNCASYGVVGALTGFAAKYALPVTEKEKDKHNYIMHKRNSRAEVSKELKNFIEAIKADAQSGNEASQIFTDTFTKQKSTASVLKSAAFKNASNEIKQDVQLLAQQYNTLKYNGAENARVKFNTMVKASRSTNTFLALGALGGILIAVANNALNANAQKLAQGKNHDTQKSLSISV